jgi:hypothetical protein
LPPLGRVAGHDVPPPSEPELLDDPELELDEPELEPDELELEGLPELDPEASELDPVPVPLELEPELEPPAPEPEPEDVPELEPEPEVEPADESDGPPPAASSSPPSGALPWDDPQATVAKRAKAQTVHVVPLIPCGIIRPFSQWRTTTKSVTQTVTQNVVAGDVGTRRQSNARSHAQGMSIPQNLRARSKWGEPGYARASVAR